MDREATLSVSVAWIYDLYRIGQATASAENSDAAQQQILEHIVTGLKATSGCLALANDDQSLRIVAGIKLPAEAIGSTVAAGDGVLGWVAQHGEALLLNGDISRDPRFHNRPARTQTGIPAVALCWPLKMEGRVIGVLSVNRDASAPPFVEADLERGRLIANLVAIVIHNALLTGRMKRQIADLAALNARMLEMNHRLEQAQNQLLQSEKMASIGQLAAGVAHEINNPVGYIASNLNTLKGYVDNLLEMVDLYTAAEASLAADTEAVKRIRDMKANIDFDFVRGDIRSLVEESLEGVGRVRKIVQDLKEFSHVDRAEWQLADLHAGIDSTLNIVWNELKYKAEIVKQYGTLPAVECIPSQLNQVFMNLLVNAAQAIEERGTITIETGTDGDGVFVTIRDTGKGMTAEVQKRIFEPFFTTKPVGKGTGLGLSLAYGIIQRHHGRITVQSEPGKGTAFTVWLPVNQPQERTRNAA